MSKAKKQVVVTRTVSRNDQTVAKRKTSEGASFKSTSHPLIFTKTNYSLMLAGIGLIALGLFLMSGGAMPSPDVWDESIIYSKRRTVIGPFVIILGLVLEIYAIFKKDVAENDDELRSAEL